MLCGSCCERAECVTIRFQVGVRSIFFLKAANQSEDVQVIVSYFVSY